MPVWKKNVYILWVAVFIAAVCWSMVMPFMPVFIRDELGVTTGVAFWAGVLGAVNSLGMVIMSPVWGAVGDRYGRKAMMLRAGFCLTVLYVLMSMVQGIYHLVGVRVLIGMLTGFIPTATALVGTTTPQEHLGKALALVSTAAPTGSILGPMVGGLFADLVGIRGSMVVSSVMAGSATLLVLLLVKEKFTPVRHERVNLLASVTEVLQYRAFAGILVGTTTFMAATAVMEPVLIPYVKGLLYPGAPSWLAGALYSMPGVAYVIMAPWWAGRAAQWGHTVTMTVGLALGGLVILPQALAGTAWEFGGLRLTQGIFTAAVTPGVAALIAQAVPPALRGRAYGLNQSAFSVGNMAGPLLGGFLATVGDPRWVFVAAGLMLLAAAVWARLVVTPRLAAQTVAGD